MQATQSPTFWRKMWKPALLAAAVLSLLLIVTAVASVWRDLGQSGPALVYYTAVQGDLPIVVTERGNLESQQETVIRNQVQSLSYDRNSGSSGSTILWIVANGETVEEGDLLVELDSAQLSDRLDTETLEWQGEQSQLLQAQARHANQETQNETSLAQAKLDIQLAELQLEMYIDEQNGTFQLEHENILRQIDDTRNTILEAQAALELERTNKEGIEELFKLGYKGKSELDQSNFSFMRAQSALSAAMNRMKNHTASADQLREYTYKMEVLRAQGAVETAKRNLEQVKVTSESELAQVEAQLFEAREGEARERARVELIKRQLEFCKIYAPHAGMAVYAQDERNRGGRFGNMSEIGLGATVRERQALLTLPDLTKMQIKTQIHEAVLDQVRTGLPVTVRVDAVPNRTYDGVVTSVAVVPAMNFNSNVKTYDCVIKIIEEVQQLRPGMTAVCEIHVDRLRNVLSVPVQAVVQIDKETWCYVDSGTGAERRDVELGRSNDKFVHLVTGVQPGERVVLNPMAILSEEQRTESPIAPEKGASDAPEIPVEELDVGSATENRPERGGRSGRDWEPQNGGEPGAEGPRERRGRGRGRGGRGQWDGSAGGFEGPPGEGRPFGGRRNRDRDTGEAGAAGGEAAEGE